MVRAMINFLGDEPVSEFQLHFAPRWFIENAVNSEKDNYRDAHENVDIRKLSADMNLISSHYSIQIKHGGAEDKFRLKFRLVSHVNRDRDRRTVCQDDASAQMVIIRIVLSISCPLSIKIATLYVKKVYLQSDHLQRDGFMCPSNGWSSSTRVVCKPFKPAYGLVESARLWQLVIDKWLTEHFI